MSSLLLALLLAQTPAPSPSSGQIQPADALVAGRVVDAVTGKAVTGVVVTLTPRAAPGAPPLPVPARGEIPDPTTQPVRVLVDAGGRFAFTALRAGHYDVTAARRGYVAGAFGKLRADGAGIPFALDPSERRTDVVIRVWKHASIAGIVVDEANEPVVGVSVFLQRREWIGGELRLNAAPSTATTDDRGAYRIGSLLPGDYLVVVPSTQDTIPTSALDQVTTNPSPPPDIRDAVATVAGQALPLGHRDVQRAGDFVLHGRPRAVITPDPTSDGGVTVYPTAYLPEAPGTVSTATLITLAASEARVVTPIRLRPTSSVRVSGLVTGPSGPAALFTLVLAPVAADGFASEYGFEAARTVTNAAGEYTFLGVTPGVYRMRGSVVSPAPPPPGAAAPGYAVAPPVPTLWLSETITVGARDVTLPLTAHSGFTVSGHVVFEGQRAPPKPEQTTRGLVSIARADGRQVRDLLGRDAGAVQPGTFQWADIAGGRYVFRVAAPSGWSLKSITRGGQDAIDAPFDLTEDISNVVVTFTDRPTSVRGTALTTAGAPDADALVIIFPVTPQRWTDAGRSPIQMRTARPSPSGAYSFSGLPPGSYFIAAVHDASASTWQTARFLEALSRQATRLRLDEGAAITQDLRRSEIK